MAMRDEDFGTDLNLVVGDDGDWSPPEVVATQPSRDWRSVLVQERTGGCGRSAREALRWAEVDSRARAGSLKWQLDRSRSKLKAATEEACLPCGRNWRACSNFFWKPALSQASLTGSPRDTVAASKARKDAVGRAFGQEHRVRVTPEGVRHQKDDQHATQGDHPAQQGGDPAGQADPRAEQAPGAGEGEVGELQGDRPGAIPRIPSTPSGDEDIARLGPGPVPCPRRCAGCALPWTGRRHGTRR